MKNFWFCLFGLFLIVKVGLVFSQNMPVNLLAIDLVMHIAGDDKELDYSAIQSISKQAYQSSITNQRMSALWLCEKGFYLDCENKWRYILQQTESDPIALFWMANLLAKTEREEEAISLWRQAGSARYWSFQGNEDGGCECILGTEGLCYLQRAALIDPSDGIVRFYLGRQQALCGQWASAYVSLTVALDSNELENHNRHEALLRRAESAFQAGLGLEAAVNDIETAINIQSQNPWSRIRLCNFYRLEGHYELALTSCNKAVELAPQLGYSYYYRGRLWHSWGYLAEAISDYQEALFHLPALSAAEDWLKRAQQENE